MTVLVVLTVVVIVALIAGLAFYLYWAGTLLDRIGANLEGAADIVRGIVADAKLIGPGVEHINQLRRRGRRSAPAAVRHGRADRRRRHPGAARAGGARARPPGLGHPPLPPAARRRLRAR